MNRKIPVFQKADSNINFHINERSNFHLRLYALPFFVIFLFGILFVRLFQLTIVKGSYYRYIAEKNRIHEISLEAPRGTIVDRKGYTLAYSTPLGDKQVRTYNEGLAIASVVGYRQNASTNDIKNDLCDQKLRLNDKVGKAGIEQVFECQLRGIKGKKLVEVNAQGNYLQTLSVQNPVEGQKITLSIDLELQKKAYELVRDKRASVIVTNPQTGQILALVSSPSFDPQYFENDDSSVLKTYLEDENKPLFNRPLHGVYPAGSVFKTVLATGALEEKKIDENFEVDDHGFIKAGPLIFNNWYWSEYGKTEGIVNIVKAIKRSNDTFFYKLGEKMGLDDILKWSQLFGYGKSTKILLGDSEGLIPTAFWKKDQLKEQWYLGDTYNLAIGQGYLQVTPLQVAMATLPFANGGNICKPQLLKDAPVECKSLHISEKTMSLIREGMKEACSSGGTGWPLFNFSVDNKPIQAGCKTGTAESHLASGIPHAWFTSFAPFDKPEIVVTVMVEESGQGSDIGGPVVRDIYKAYFGRKN